MSDGAAQAALEAGLLAEQKRVESKYFYDQRGSEIFEEITTLEEYYPTRTERALLDRWSETLVERVRPRSVLELGAGSARKTRVLLGALERHVPGATYIPLDVSADFLAEVADELRHEYPGLRIVPHAADFTAEIELDAPLERPALVALLGSTIGNFDVPGALELLRHVVMIIEPRDHFLMGVDLRPGPNKSREELEAAYNDAHGVTAEFNLNILRVLNARFGTDFDRSAFEHDAWYNDEEGRIEMHLRAASPQRVRLPSGAVSEFGQGETLRTEISCKYDRPTVDALFSRVGLRMTDWLDCDGRYALAVGQAAR
ncbi:MAG: L-histidine N(alpha)-methyltransferase [Longimicrobiales bacterium]|nr:L-histidine N(alpha)-methyltransferase [Longimicrobiales bacterium]